MWLGFECVAEACFLVFLELGGLDDEAEALEVEDPGL